MNRDFPNPTSLRCTFCGSAGTARPLDGLIRNYQIIVACGSCGVSFVLVSRN